MKSAVHCPPSNSLRNLSILLLVLELLRIIGFRYSLTYWFITPWSNISILAALLGWSAAQDTRKFGSGFGSLGAWPLAIGLKMASIVSTNMVILFRSTCNQYRSRTADLLVSPNVGYHARVSAVGSRTFSPILSAAYNRARIVDQTISSSASVLGRHNQRTRIRSHDGPHTSAPARILRRSGHSSRTRPGDRLA